MSSEKCKVYLQYVIPQKLLSEMIGYLARAQFFPWLRRFAIRYYVRHFKVDMSLAEKTNINEYASFNEFFTRALKPEVRPVVADPRAIACPVDGTVSEIGIIESGLLLQAKGHRYQLAELLAHDVVLTQAFEAGSFITAYLSPRDYHRIHMPLRGQLRRMIYVPGRLFSVSPTTAQHIPGLFARNERVICHFKTAIGPMVVILVGAMIVGSVETVWAGRVIPPRLKLPTTWDYNGENAITLEKGQELGRFQLGSTVIVLFPKKTMVWNEKLVAGTSLQMGQSLGQLLND